MCGFLERRIPGKNGWKLPLDFWFPLEKDTEPQERISAGCLCPVYLSPNCSEHSPRTGCPFIFPPASLEGFASAGFCESASTGLAEAPLRAHRKVLFQDTVETIEIEGGTQNVRTVTTDGKFGGVRRFNEVSLLSSEIASAHFVSELKQGRATQLALLTDTDAVDDLARWDTRAASDDALHREVNTLVQAAHSRGTALAA